MMRNYYQKHTREYPWLIKEEGWVKSLQGVRESQLAVGNGLLGSRAVLEELPPGTRPGTYVAGVYDRIGSQVAELVNLPNPFNFKVVVEGEKVGVATMDVLQHRRTLDLRHGVLCRHSVFQNRKGHRYDLQSMRFLSMADKNIGVMQVVLTSLDAGVTASIETGIDTSVYNTGGVTEGRKKHFRMRELGQFQDEGYLIVETYDKRYTVIFRSGFHYETRGKKTVAQDNIFELKLRKNQTVVFTKVFSVDRVSRGADLDRAKELSEKKFRRAFWTSFKSLLGKHTRAWEALWSVAEVSIWGDPEVEKNFRFNIYHMLICAPEDGGIASVGARTLSGEGYRGHVFWDAEIFILPFYLYALPWAAKNMLHYRYRRLDAARAQAREKGFKGAMFPWESAGKGEDETPGWAKDLDGKVIRIHTGQMQHHITADIAYAFYHYYNVTHDREFLEKCGYEVLFETARFWASRVKYNKRKKTYEIRDVIGPDEFHTHVNNDAYTNMMARWNLLTACKLFRDLNKSDPALLRSLMKKLQLSRKEASQWRTVAAGIPITTNRNQVIEQFDGYFKKRPVKITHWDENSLPVITGRLTPRNYSKTQLVKQADVVMLLYLLSDAFKPSTKRRNYEYYVERTTHSSSLSLPVHALMAVEVDDPARAYQFFNTAVHTDISNVNGNTDEGIHAACLGGTWQVLVNGFAGVRVDREVLSINPSLPRRWRKVLFHLHWRGALLAFEIQSHRVQIQIVSPNRRRIKIKVFGVLHEVTGKKKHTFEQKRAARDERAYYL